MINISIKKLFRRCLLIAVIGVATGCASTKQMPSSPVEVQERSFVTSTTLTPVVPKVEVVLEALPPSAPVLKVINEDLVLETPAQNGNLVKYVSKRFKLSETAAQDIINTADKYASDSFPKRNDILAIIAVESGYNTRAQHRGCFGLMQIQKVSHSKSLRGRSLYNPAVNIEIGTGVLTAYYDLLKGNKRGAILSFNAGIGNFLKGRYVTKYHQKYLAELKLISQL